MFKAGFENTVARKPDFFVVGAPKCGTTSFYHYFSQHPDIHLIPKETHFYCTDLQYPEAQCTMEKYATELSKAANGKIIGDVEVNNLCSKQAAENIFRMNPDALIIILLRNPVHLLQSLHAQHRINGSEPHEKLEDAFEHALNGIEKETMPAYYTSPLELYDYPAMGDFLPQVQRYYAIFPEENIKVFLLEELQANTDLVLQETWSFLNLKPPEKLNLEAQNTRKTISNYKLYSWLISGAGFGKELVKKVIPNVKKRKAIKQKLLNVLVKESKDSSSLDPVFYQKLLSRYEPDFEALSKLTGKDLSVWTKK